MFLSLKIVTNRYKIIKTIYICFSFNKSRYIFQLTDVVHTYVHTSQLHTFTLHTYTNYLKAYTRSITIFRQFIYLTYFNPIGFLFFSITSDNGRNMLKAVEILNETSEMSEELDLGVEEIVDSITLPNIQSIRCAAHTLQLCVNDINKDINICQKIETARKLCKTLRIPKNRYYTNL